MKNITFLLSAPGKIVALLSGWKTYMVGASMMLLALSGQLTALSNVTSIMDLLAMAKAFSSDPNMKMLLEGLAIITGRNAIAKLQ